MAPTWTKLTYGNRIQDGATVGLEVMGMGHDGYWGCCLLATFCFFLLIFCSWFKWICSLCNNSLTCTHKIHTFFWCQNTYLKTRLIWDIYIYIHTYIHTHIYIYIQSSNFIHRVIISLLRCKCTCYFFQILSLYNNNICLCSCDLPFILLCANNMHTKNLSRNLKFPKC